MIEKNFLKHPRNRGHRCRLYWKHHFRKLAIEQALKLDGDFWLPSKGESFKVTGLASYVPGTCDWKESLVKRPEGET